MRHYRDFFCTLFVCLSLTFGLSACGTKGPLTPPPQRASAPTPTTITPATVDSAKPASTSDDSKAPSGPMQ